MPGNVVSRVPPGAQDPVQGSDCGLHVIDQMERLGDDQAVEAVGRDVVGLARSPTIVVRDRRGRR